MKLQKIKCTQCKRNFFVELDDFESMKVDERKDIDLYAYCPFECDIIVGEQTILDLGTVEFNDKSKLDAVLIRSVADRLAEILHEVENMGAKDDQA